MSPCGLWPARRVLVAVVVDDDGRAAPPLRVERSDPARWALLEYLDAVHGTDCGLVVPEGLPAIDPVGRLAQEHGLLVWSAPQRLLDAIRAVAGLATGPPRRTAAMLARLPLVPALRDQLRRLGPANDRRQLPLL